MRALFSTNTLMHCTVRGLGLFRHTHLYTQTKLPQTMFVYKDTPSKNSKPRLICGHLGRRRMRRTKKEGGEVKREMFVEMEEVGAG